MKLFPTDSKTNLIPFLHNAEFRNTAPLALVSRNTCSASCPQIYLEKRNEKEKNN